MTMFQNPAETKEPNTKYKCFVVLFTLGREAEKSFGKETAIDFSPLRIFASELMARCYCEQHGREFQRIDKTIILDWMNRDTLLLYKQVGDRKEQINCRFEIHETVIDEDFPSDFHYPPIEKENEVLRLECYRLRKELAEVTQRNAVAATYATMWDGGRDYTKESVLDILNTVRDVLAGDHAKVRELYETWKKKEGNKA